MHLLCELSFIIHAAILLISLERWSLETLEMIIKLQELQLGSIYNWGTKKECIIFKGLKRKNLNVSSICIIIIVTNWCHVKLIENILEIT